MADVRVSFTIQPGRGLGWMTLGASLHAILTRLKSQPQHYPKLELAYSLADPILDPVVVDLPANGLRLRFDGPDQRLRLIEILDFSRSTFTYKSTELVRRSNSSSDQISDPIPGPSFKHLYNRLFGPSYPGEYISAASADGMGTYILSWPGLAARFSLRQKLWSDRADFVSLLSSVASPATSIAIFNGSAWSEARESLYSRRPALPRALALAGKANDTIPDEIDEIVIHDGKKLELFRRLLSPFTITLNETTTQDLVAELGPPDAIFRKPTGGLSIHAGGMSMGNRRPSTSQALESGGNDYDHSSNKSYTDDSEMETAPETPALDDDANTEVFYNYFHHGFDILVSTPQSAGSTARGGTSAASPADFVATKIFLHGNIPGSYSFNRHRRCRWRISLDDNGQPLSLTSEMRFQEVSDILKDVWHGSYQDAEEERRLQRGMVLNRGWGIGDSPESSIELLGGFEEGPHIRDEALERSSIDAGMSTFNNTELFGFPGLLFEVLKNDTISCLTVYKHD